MVGGGMEGSRDSSRWWLDPFSWGVCMWGLTLCSLLFTFLSHSFFVLLRAAQLFPLL